MKKLFFLCAFLFMSVQMPAQLYIVHLDVFNGEGVLITIAPNGDISQLPCPMPNNSLTNLSEHIQVINNELNTIIDSGYKLIHVDRIHSEGVLTSLSGFFGITYYLSVP